jgi:hypothetical protein
MNLQKKLVEDFSCIANYLWKNTVFLRSYRTFYYSYVKNFNRNTMKIEFSVLLFNFTYSLSQKIVKLHVPK